MIIQIIVVALIVAGDRITKMVLPDILSANGGYIELWKGVFNLKLVENTGAAFGMLKDARWLFIAVTIVAIIIAVVYTIKERRNMPWMFKLALAMIIGGAIGNLIDRVLTGVVIDFFYFELINFAVFNVADIFVTVGAILLGIDIVFFYDKREQQKKMKDEK